MPLGYSGYFDIPGAFSGYESALTDLAGSQQKTDFWDFLGELGPILQQLMERKRQQELQGRQQGMAEQRVGISQQYLDLAKQTEGREQTWDQYRMGQPPKQLTGEQLWLANHPGKGHEDYLRATKGITAEFKEPKKPEFGIEDPRMKRMLKERDKQETRLIGYAKEWRTHRQKIQKEYDEQKGTEGQRKTPLLPPSWSNIFHEWLQTIPLTSDRVSLMTSFSKSGLPQDREPFGLQGKPHKEENDLINQLKDRAVNWEQVMNDYPDLDWDYIRQLIPEIPSF